MPVYCYQCKDCDYEFEIRHSMSYDEQKCVECDSSNIFKIPSISTLKKKFTTQRVGKVVDEYIRDTKEMIEKQKKSLKSEVM